MIHKLTTFYLGLDQLDMAEKYMAKGLTLDSTHAQLLGVKAKLAYAKKDYSAVVYAIDQCLFHGMDKFLILSGYLSSKVADHV